MSLLVYWSRILPDPSLRPVGPDGLVIECSPMVAGAFTIVHRRDQVNEFLKRTAQNRAIIRDLTDGSRHAMLSLGLESNHGKDASHSSDDHPSV